MYPGILENGSFFPLRFSLLFTRKRHFLVPRVLSHLSLRSEREKDPEILRYSLDEYEREPGNEVVKNGSQITCGQTKTEVFEYDAVIYHKLLTPRMLCVGS